MVRKTMLEQNVEDHMKKGYKVFAYGQGIPSDDERSNMGKIIKKCKSKHPKSNVRGISGGKIRGGKNRLPWDSAINWAVVYKGN
jgi:hypothetical protein